MNSSTSAGRPLVREGPMVGEYRRGSRLRTTPAGTWFPAVSPDGESAGLLLVHPGVDTKVLLPTLERLAELVLPGVLAPRPALVEQAGRNWLVTDAPAVPTLADVLGGDGPHRTPSNAAALLSDVAATLLATHRSGLAHGAVDARSVLIGQDGAALLTDWGTSASANAAADVRAWAKLAAMLAERWCAEDVESAAALARAVQAATGPTGLAGGFDQLRRLAHTAARPTLAATAKGKLAALRDAQVRPPRSVRRAAAQAARAAATIPDTPTPDTPTPDTSAAPTADRTAPHAADGGTPTSGIPPTTAPEPPPPGPATPRRRIPPSTPPARPTPTPPKAWSPVATEGRPENSPDAAKPWAPRGVEPGATDPGRAGPLGARPRSTGEVPRWQLALLAVVTVVTLVVGATDLVLLLTRSTTEPTSGLEIRSISVRAQRDGASCTLVGLITTNGTAGTVTYGWTGDSTPGPAMTVPARDGQPRIEVTQVWSAAANPTRDPVVTLRLLKPSAQQASVQQASIQPASVCGR